MAANDSPILLDVTRLAWRRWAGRHPTGIDRVCLAYLRHFGDRAQAVLHHRRFRRIFDREASARLFQLLAEPPANFRAAFVRECARQLLPVERAGGGRLYLNIGHTGLDRDGFRSWVEKADVRPVYFVHDLIPLTHPHFCRVGEALRHRSRMRTVLGTAAGVIANSQATIDELADFADRNGLPFPPSLAAWLGSSPFARPARVDEPSLSTFVALGTIEARKNHLLLLRIWSKLAASLGERAPRLLIIGQRGWEADEVFRILDEDSTLRGHVVEINGASDADIASRLASSRALLFPSNAEGYGLPLVEALGLGVPVIASDLPVFREIGQGVPLLLDPADESGWEAAILDYARPESAARAAQVARMKAFQPPNWPDHFRAVDAWLPTLR